MRGIKALGAHVATTTSSQNSDYVRGLGADEVIVYDQGSLHTVSCANVTAAGSDLIFQPSPFLLS
ncbi:hypothetical protein [Brevibacillus brevis]|nr:hypothetical protein [Brevibacillus brevis]